MSTFRHHREIDARPSEVFAAFKDPVRLARWWGPSGFHSSFHRFEFRNEGAWLFTMHGPDGKSYPNESKFVEVVPDARVRIKHLNLPHFDLSISLEPKGSGTAVIWVGVMEDQEFAERAREFLESANEQNLDRLAAEVRDGASNASPPA